jgi:Leucine-rich repeat (LRR) protein
MPRGWVWPCWHASMNALPKRASSALVQLRSLEAGSNELTALPESIGRLAGLESLDLRGNRLAALAASFAIRSAGCPRHFSVTG